MTDPATLRWLAAAGLMPLLLLWPLLTCGFTDWDDPQTVWLNPFFNPPTLAGIAHFWSHAASQLYIPFTYTVWGVTAIIAQEQRGLDPHVFHALNLMLHVGATGMIFAILRQLRLNAPAAAFGAIVFAVHPLQVETVGWVSGTKDLLCGLLSLAAIYCYLRAADAPDSAAGYRRRAIALATVMLVLAMLSKPTAVVAPLIAGLIDVVLLGRPIRKAARVLLPWLALAAVVVVIARLAQPGTRSAALAPMWARPLVATDALAFYLRKLVWPVGLAIDYGRSPQQVYHSGAIYYTWIIPAIVGAALLIIGRRRRMPLVAGLIFVAGLAPVLGLVPFAFQHYSTVADHYVYLSMSGVALGCAWIFQQVANRPIRLAGAAVVMVLGIVSFRQTWVWRDTVSLMDQTLTVNPASAAAHTNLTVAYLSRHDGPNALKHALAALALDPAGPAENHLNLGLAYAMSHRFSDAERELRRAVELDPSDASARICLGDVLVEQGDYSAAETQFAEAQRLAPNDPIVAQRVREFRAKRPAATTRSQT